MDPRDRDALSELAHARPGAARTMRSWWDSSALDYARALRARPPQGEFEPALQWALEAEAERVGQPVPVPGVVDTAQHLTPTSGPGFLFADWIAGLGAERPPARLLWSSVAFSNSARSGALSIGGLSLDELLLQGPELRRQRRAQADRGRDGGERLLGLVPSRLRDGLVHGTPLPERTAEVLGTLRPALLELLASPLPGDDFAAWALRAGTRVQEIALGRPVGGLDLGRICASWLARLLVDPERFDARVAGLERQSPWFWGRRQRKGRERLLPLYWRSDGVQGDGSALDRAELIEALDAGGVAPGLPPSFSLLAWCNPLRCLGSFAQVDYLPELRRQLGARASTPVEAELPDFVGGRAVDESGKECFPLELALRGEVFAPDPATPMRHFWRPLVRRLTGRLSERESGPLAP